MQPHAEPNACSISKMHGIHVIKLDVTDESSIRDCVGQIQKESGGIDILVNNAGYGSYGSIEEVPLAEARRQVEVNLFGLAALTQLAIPHMRDQRWAGSSTSPQSAAWVQHLTEVGITRPNLR